METKAVIIDTTTNEITERPFNLEELAADKKFRDEMAKIAEQKEKIENEKIVKKMEAQAKLAALGLTTEDLKALGL
jgi:hypothetical protein